MDFNRLGRRGNQNMVFVFKFRRKDIFNLINIIHIDTVFFINMGTGAFKRIGFKEYRFFGFLNSLGTFIMHTQHRIMLLFELARGISAKIDKKQLFCGALRGICFCNHINLISINLVYLAPSIDMNMVSPQARKRDWQAPVL